MEITQERNVDCAPQRVVTVQGEIGICLKEEVGQFSSLLPGTVQGQTHLHGCHSTLAGYLQVPSKWTTPFCVCTVHYCCTSYSCVIDCKA
jgi:hypothetical protein